MCKRKMSTPSGKTTSAHLLLYEAISLYQKQYMAVNCLKLYKTGKTHSGGSN